MAHRSNEERGSVGSFATGTQNAVTNCDARRKDPQSTPSSFCGTGSAWASAFGRIGSFAVPGDMALLLGTWTQGYQLVFIMFACILVLGALLLAILGEETKGRTLEEISAKV